MSEQEVPVRISDVTVRIAKKPEVSFFKFIVFRSFLVSLKMIVKA